MATFQDLIHQTRHYLMTGQPDRLNVLQTTVDLDDTAIQFTYELKGIADGTQLSIDLEEMHVLSVSGTGAGDTATVIRGVNGSTAVAHTAGAIIRVAPQFSDFRIGKYINESLTDISAQGIFRIRPIEFTYIPAVAGYNLNVTDLIDVWRVSYNEPGPDNDWRTIRNSDWFIDQAANTTDFPQGIKLVIRNGGYPGHLIRVAYRAGFTALTAVANDVLTTSGLHTEAHDIPPIGAAISLLSGREIKRSFLNRQPEPRRQDEVPPGSSNQAMAPLLKMYQDRIYAESRRLKRRYPGTT